MKRIETYQDIQRFERNEKARSILAVVSVILITVAVFICALMIGNYQISITQVFRVILGLEDDPILRYIIFDVRIPRLLCGLIVGGALSTAGLVMQSLFKNPMASPSVLGISSGAAFGAALAIAFGVGGFLGEFMVPVMAFVFCFITMGIVYLLARTKYGVATTTLLLAGVAMGAFFNGLVSLLQYIVNEDVLSSIVYWTMGSLNNCGWFSFKIAILPIIAGLFLVLINIKELNLISAGEEQAANIGVNVKRVRLALILATSLLVGGSVAITGVIGFVGLIVPHIFRMILGPNHRTLVPLCIIGGGAFMIIMDTISKSAFEIILPVGILTSLIGAPFFIYVLRNRKRELWE